MTKAMRDQIQRAMTLAAARGFNPYDNHAALAKKWADCERMRAMRSRSEAEANQWLRRNS